jgi:hypothetical protein
VDLRPDGEHDVAEEEGVEGDQRDVAAEAEGEDDADEEEEHAGGFFAFEVLSRQDRHHRPSGIRPPSSVLRPQLSAIGRRPYQQRGREHSEERPEIHHPLPDHPRRDRRSELSNLGTRLIYDWKHDFLKTAQLHYAHAFAKDRAITNPDHRSQSHALQLQAPVPEIYCLWDRDNR